MVLPDLSSLVVVTRRDTGLALLEPEQQRYLLPFLGGNCTVKEAADRTACSLNSMYARVIRFVRLGLVRVVGVQPRAGRALKLYRATAERFFVPASLVGLETVEAVQAKSDAFWERELRRSLLRARMGEAGEWGFELSRDEDGAFWVHGAAQPGNRYNSSATGTPATVHLWSEQIRLDYEDAKSFQRELLELYRKYRGKSGAQRYLLRIGLAPWQRVWPE